MGKMMSIARMLLGLLGGGIAAAPWSHHPPEAVLPRPAATPMMAMQNDTAPVVISGVVHPRGASGSQDGPAAPWILALTLETWRGADGVIRPTELTVTRRVADAEVRGWMDRIRPGAVVTLRVRLTGPNSAELVDLLEHAGAPDEALARRAAELAAPVTRRHPRFGTLELNRALGWYEGAGTWEGKPVLVYLEAGDDAALDSALAAAERLWSNQRGWGERIRDYAVRELLPLKNGDWLDDGEAPVTPDRFRARMTLQSITVSPNGSFDFMHDDGDLFAGHSIQVTGTLDEGPTDADIPG